MIRGIAGQVVAGAQQREPYRPTRARQMAGGGEAIAAIVPRPTQNSHRAHGPARLYGLRDRAAGGP
jgi:hypothetical protein